MYVFFFFPHFQLYHFYAAAIYRGGVRMFHILENFSDECLGSGYDEGRSELR